MKIIDYKELISYLPVRQQCVTTKRSFWVKGEELEWVKPIHDSLFDENDLLTISRQDLFDTEEIKALVLKIIYWGMPLGMTWRGSPFLNVLQEIDRLQQLKEYRNQNITIAQYHHLRATFDSITKMGLTVYSKLLYFLNVKVENMPCLILENKLVNIFRKKTFDEFTCLKKMNESNKKSKYIEYVKGMYDVSLLLETKGENIEQFLSIFGMELKPIESYKSFSFEEG